MTIFLIAIGYLVGGFVVATGVAWLLDDDADNKTGPQMVVFSGLVWPLTLVLTVVIGSCAVLFYLGPKWLAKKINSRHQALKPPAAKVKEMPDWRNG